MRSVDTHIDERGSLFEVFSQNWNWDDEELKYVYGVTIRPGATKGWALHKLHQDRYFVVSGDMKVVMYDVRPGSSTSGRVFEVCLSGQRHTLMNIPEFVWHADQNIGDQDVVMLNIPTQPYDHSDPDKYRLPLDTTLIPYEFRNTSGW